MFAALYSADDERAPALLSCAQAFSPRVEAQLGGRLILIDVAGLGRIVGDAHAVAAELEQNVARRPSTGSGRPELVEGRTSHVIVVVAPSRIAAWLLAVAGHAGVVLPGRTTTAVGALDLSVFDTLANDRNLRNHRNPSTPRQPRTVSCSLCSLAGVQRFCGRPGGACTELATLRRWGLSTLGDVAALPAAELSARLGQMGVVLQRLARGLDMQPLVPIVEEARFEASLDLEWPVADLQPLSFVLARLLDPLNAALERADRGAAAIVTALTLVRLKTDEPRSHVRRLELPAPMRDPRVLRTLILLDLESHPPNAGIDRVSVRLEPTPARIVQFSLLERAGPQPETIATLVSRLTALMGEGRIGSPVMLDSYAPDAFVLDAFSGRVPEARGQMPEARGQTGARSPAAALGVKAGSQRDVEPELASGIRPLAPVMRRFRLPVAARVVIAADRVVGVTTDRVGIKGGDVQQCAGPWRSSGQWWGPGGPSEQAAWDRDEYDVALSDGAAYRIYRDRHEDKWFIEGILD